MTSNFSYANCISNCELNIYIHLPMHLAFGGYYKMRVFQVKYASVSSVSLIGKVTISWNYSIKSIKKIKIKSV